MKNDEFLKWRRENDYPRIIHFLKKALPDFEEWMQTQNISDEDLLTHFPSSFLKEYPELYLYIIASDNNQERKTLSIRKYEPSSKESIKEQKIVLAYPTWIRKIKKTKPRELDINESSGRSHFLMSNLELIDMGNIHISNMFFSGRQLDFVNLDGLRISSCLNNSSFKIWFSSAVNMTFEGDFPFVEGYKTRFYDHIHLKYNNLKLLNGSFQRWRFDDCGISLTATNSILYGWNLTGWDFSATISNTDIKSCSFKNSEVKYPIAYGRMMNFHSQVKRLYSQVGRKKEASNHYYLEKTFERKTFVHVRPNYQDSFYRKKTKVGKRMLRFSFFLRYLYSGFLNILWGYGERPSRVFLISLSSILIFAFLYCFLPGASPDTFHSFGNSLYFSMVTFTTLGYGDISQHAPALKILCGLEAIFGMTFWGILIAGFTSKAKDY